MEISEILAQKNPHKTISLYRTYTLASHYFFIKEVIKW